MKRLKIKVKTSDPKLKEGLFHIDTVQKGFRVSVPEIESELIFDDYPGRRAFGETESFMLLLNFAVGVSASLIATWLYERFKDRVISFKINDKDIELTKNTLEKEIKKAKEEERGQ